MAFSYKKGVHYAFWWWFFFASTPVIARPCVIERPQAEAIPAANQDSLVCRSPQQSCDVPYASEPALVGTE
jgi:hypothetical protein